MRIDARDPRSARCLIAAARLDGGARSSGGERHASSPTSRAPPGHRCPSRHATARRRRPTPSSSRSRSTTSSSPRPVRRGAPARRGRFASRSTRSPTGSTRPGRAAASSPLCSGRVIGRSFDFPKFSGPNGILAMRVATAGQLLPGDRAADLLPRPAEGPLPADHTLPEQRRPDPLPRGHPLPDRPAQPSPPRRIAREGSPARTRGGDPLRWSGGAHGRGTGDGQARVARIVRGRFASARRARRPSRGCCGPGAGGGSCRRGRDGRSHRWKYGRRVGADRMSPLLHFV